MNNETKYLDKAELNKGIDYFHLPKDFREKYEAWMKDGKKGPKPFGYTENEDHTWQCNVIY